MQETMDISPYRQGLKTKILETAMKDFMAKGIRAVKMDDVASELCISKRTLYEIYENKELLLFEAVKAYYRNNEAVLETETRRCKNVMQVLLVIYRKKVDDFRRTNPVFYTDLVKYPKVLEFLEQQNQRMRNQSAKFIERGIDEGFFRSDLNYELTSKLFEAMGKYVMDSQVYRQYGIEDIFRNIVFVSLRGICTTKGIEALDKLK